MKVVNLYLCIILIFLFSYVSSAKLGMETFRKYKLHKILSRRINNEISYNSMENKETQVYYRGWVKYLHFTEKEISKPKAFFKNVEFDIQKKRLLYSQEREKEKDEV